MSYTTCKHVTLIDKGSWEYQESWMNKSFFYKKDIDLVWSQPGVEAVEIMKAVVDGQETLVMVGVKIYKDQQNDMSVNQRLDQPHHFVALLCPPFQRQGGEYLNLQPGNDSKSPLPGSESPSVPGYD